MSSESFKERLKKSKCFIADGAPPSLKNFTEFEHLASLWDWHTVIEPVKSVHIAATKTGSAWICWFSSSLKQHATFALGLHKDLDHSVHIRELRYPSLSLLNPQSLPKKIRNVDICFAQELTLGFVLSSALLTDYLALAKEDNACVFEHCKGWSRFRFSCDFEPFCGTHGLEQLLESKDAFNESVMACLSPKKVPDPVQIQADPNTPRLFSLK